MQLHLIATLGTLLCAATPVSPGKTELTWLGHAAWQVKTPGGATLLIDPWLDNPKAPKDYQVPNTVDAILVTHGHFDHAAGVAELAKKTGALVIGSYELIGLLGVPEAKAAGGNAGGTVRVRDAVVHLTEAVHSSGFGPPGAAPQYAGAPLGFVVAVDKGVVFYHAGDTDAFASMALIGERYHPSVALLPIGGHFTLDPAGAAFAAKLLRVKTVVPMHYGTFPLLAGTPAELEKAASGFKVRVASVGESLAF